MELSVKKLNNAIKRFVEKDYQFGPSRLLFDYLSDKEYMYIAFNQHYIIRTAVSDIQYMSEIYKLSCSGCILENMIVNEVNRPIVDFTMGETEKIVCAFKEIEVVNFYSSTGIRISVDAKFFSTYYNKPIYKYGVPDNITFSAVDRPDTPLIMWENDEVVALFLPIKRKD